jgi:hypothetical protein
MGERTNRPCEDKSMKAARMWRDIGRRAAAGWRHAPRAWQAGRWSRSYFRCAPSLNGGALGIAELS